MGVFAAELLHPREADHRRPPQSDVGSIEETGLDPAIWAERGRG